MPNCYKEQQTLPQACDSKFAFHSIAAFIQQITDLIQCIFIFGPNLVCCYSFSSFFTFAVSNNVYMFLFLSGNHLFHTPFLFSHQIFLDRSIIKRQVEIKLCE